MEIGIALDKALALKRDFAARFILPPSLDNETKKTSIWMVPGELIWTV